MTVTQYAANRVTLIDLIEKLETVNHESTICAALSQVLMRVKGVAVC